MRTSFFVILYLFYAIPAQAQTTEKQIFYVGLNNYFTLPFELKIGEIANLNTTNGKIIMGYLPKYFTIVPSTSEKCSLSATINGKEVWKDEYEVRTVPPPRIYLGNAKGHEVNIKTPLPLALSYRMIIRPDSTFQKNVPHLASYALDGTAVLWRGQAFVKMLDFRGGDLINFKEMGARSGDAVQITIGRAMWLTCVYTPVKVLQPYLSFFLK